MWPYTWVGGGKLWALIDELSFKTIVSIVFKMGTLHFDISTKHWKRNGFDCDLHEPMGLCRGIQRCEYIVVIGIENKPKYTNLANNGIESLL